MKNDVYVCYADEDKDIAEDVYSALRNRKLDCWMKSHDVQKDEVGEMMAAINNSRVMVLVYSANSKLSDYVNTEVDMAFSKKIPIMVFRTDDSKIDGALEFFLKPQPKFNAYEDPDNEFKRLVNKTSDLVKESKKGNVIQFIKDNKIGVIVGLAIILIVAACIYMFVPLDDINNGDETVDLNAGNMTINVTDFHVDDVSKKGYGWNYSYSVEGSISPMPSKGKGYVMALDFYDKSGNLVNTTETSFDDLQIINGGFLFGSTTSDAKDVARVEVQLLNSKDIVLAQSGSQLKNFK